MQDPDTSDRKYKERSYECSLLGSVPCNKQQRIEVRAYVSNFKAKKTKCFYVLIVLLFYPGNHTCTIISRSCESSLSVGIPCHATQQSTVLEWTGAFVNGVNREVESMFT